MGEERENTLGNAGIKDNILDDMGVISTETWCHQRPFHEDDQPVRYCGHTPPVLTENTLRQSKTEL